MTPLPGAPRADRRGEAFLPPFVAARGGFRDRGERGQVQFPSGVEGHRSVGRQPFGHGAIGAIEGCGQLGQVGVGGWLNRRDDPEFWDRVRDVCGLYLNPPERALDGSPPTPDGPCTTHRCVPAGSTRSNCSSRSCRAKDSTLTSLGLLENPCSRAEFPRASGGGHHASNRGIDGPSGPVAFD